MPKGVYVRSDSNRINIGLSKKGQKPWNTGKHLPDWVKEKISLKNTGKKRSDETKLKMSISRKGNIFCERTLFKKNHPKFNVVKKIAPRKTMEEKILRKRINAKNYKRVFKLAGKLSYETVQKVYEDNIKKYGTLTCYYCLRCLKFGEDSLEHKQPLSKGGSHLYENLCVACIKCNCRKQCKTEEEFWNILKQETILK